MSTKKHNVHLSIPVFLFGVLVQSLNKKTKEFQKRTLKIIQLFIAKKKTDIAEHTRRNHRPLRGKPLTSHRWISCVYIGQLYNKVYRRGFKQLRRWQRLTVNNTLLFGSMKITCRNQTRPITEILQWDTRVENVTAHTDLMSGTLSRVQQRTGPLCSGSCSAHDSLYSLETNKKQLYKVPSVQVLFQ